MGHHFGEAHCTLEYGGWVVVGGVCVGAPR